MQTLKPMTSSVTNKQEEINPFYDVLLHVAGIDFNKLKKSPRAEQIIYPALGVLMLLASLSTSLAMTWKFVVGGGISMWLAPIMFIFVFVFALMLEMVVVGTLKPGRKMSGNVILRVMLGFNLMIMQVVPMLVIVFSANVELYKNEQIMAKTESARVMASKSYGLSDAEASLKAMNAKLDVSRASLANPPKTAKIKEAEEKLSLLSENQGRFEKELWSANSTLSAAKAKLSNLQPAVEGYEKAKTSAEFAVEYANGRVADLEKKLYNIRTEKAAYSMKKAEEESLQADLLTAEINSSQSKIKEIEKIKVESAKKVDATVAKTKELSSAAAASRFFTDVSVLFDLMSTNVSILFTSLFVVMVALIVDLMPLLTKIQLSNGVYAKLSQDDDDIVKALSDLKKSKILVDAHQQSMLLDNQRTKLLTQQLENEYKVAALRKKQKDLQNMLAGK